MTRFSMHGISEKKADNRNEVIVDKDENGRMPGGFSKFTNVTEAVYGTSEKQVSLYRHERVRHLPNDPSIVATLQALASFLRCQDRFRL